MKVNLENLVYMVLEHFDDVKEYYRIKEGGDASSFTRVHERMQRGERAMWDFCNILGIDQQKLYNVTKGIRKWHEKRGWQVYFPFGRNSKAILEYLKA